MTVCNSIPQMAKETGVALGIFDGLHLGHRAVISAMATGCGKALLPAVFTFSGLGCEALQTDRRRDRILEDMGVAAVFQPDFAAIRDCGPERFVREVLREKLNARLAVCGENFRFGKGAAASSADFTGLCRKNGIEAIVVPLLEINGETVSSTRIRELVRAGDIPAANALLGRSFSFDFEVVTGNRIGRTLGWPTINQPFPEGFVLPRFGVYASAAHVGGGVVPSVTNIGIKPTVGGGKILAETWIRGFEGDLYGERVTVELKAFLRPEQKFPSLDDLHAQIEKDGRMAAQFGIM